MSFSNSVGSSVEMKPRMWRRPCFSARRRCSGVTAVVMPSNPAAATALILRSRVHSLAGEGWPTSDQRLAMWAIWGTGN